MVTVLIPESRQTLFKYLCQDLQDIKIVVQENALKNLSKNQKSITFPLPLLYLDVLNKKKRKINPDFEKDVFQKSLKEMGNWTGTTPETFSWK